MKVNVGGPLIAQLDIPVNQQFGILEVRMPGHPQVRPMRNRVQQIITSHFVVQHYVPEMQIRGDLRC